MNHEFYKQLIQESPVGYAYHKIICDEQGNPTDYIFLEANKAFEDLTGMKIKNIIGKKVTQIIPDIKKDKFDWISFYGEIALTGVKREFEQYSAPLNKWYRIHAYSPEKNAFIALFSDITNDKNAIEDFKKLNLISEDLLDYKGKTNIYQKITTNFLEISQAKFAAFNLYDDDGKQYTTMAVAGNKSSINKAMDILGIKLDKRKWVHDEIRAEKIKSNIITHFPTLHDLTGNVVPKFVCDVLVKTFGLGEVILIKILKDNLMIGDFTIIMPKNRPFQKENIIEVFARQVGLMIERAKSSEKVKQSEKRFRQVVKNLEVAIVILSTNGIVKDCNERALELLDVKEKALIGRNPKDFLNYVYENGQPLPKNLLPINEIIISKKPITDKVLGFYKSDPKNITWIQVSGTPIFNAKKQIEEVVISFIDFTQIKNFNDKILASEEKYRLLTTQMQLGIALHEIIFDDHHNVIDYRYISINQMFEKMSGLKKKNILGKTMLELFPNTSKNLIETYGKVAITGKPTQFEYFSDRLQKHFSISAYCPKKGQFAVIVDDITEKKQRQQQIEYLSFYDQLTGLYNRRYYEQELKRLDHKQYYPLTLIMADVNGLKLTNDAFGHNVGDLLLQKIATVLKTACRKDDFIARIGGDEFVILLPKTNAKNAEEFINRINKIMETESVEKVILSTSMGYAVKKDSSESINDIFIKAEDDMYRHKIAESKSLHSRTVQLIMKTLFERNTREMFHSERVSQLCKEIGLAMNLPKNKVDELKIAGLMHDIGKIGVPESIINKPARLTDDEWNEMKRHPEIGYRILSSSSEFSKIANYILEHHEKFDGTGYPKALKGEEISLEARIITVADSYDAMTKGRVYRKAMSKEDAIAEIIRCSGTQFDPEIVKVFVEKVIDKI